MLNQVHVFNHQQQVSIIPLVETVHENKQKTMGEVFTPAWLCNLQINLADDNWSGIKNLFNTPKDQTWQPTPDFYTQLPTEKWVEYLNRKTLEMCCGKGAYLFFCYDHITNTPISIENRFGILDRKLLVAIEYAKQQKLDGQQTFSLFLDTAKNVYGYEYQSTSLIEARQNFITTLKDFYDFYLQQTGHQNYYQPQVVEDLVCQQLFQMDGLTQCLPDSCSTNCKSCKNKTLTGHDGIKPVVFIDGQPLSFDHILKNNN